MEGIQLDLDTTGKLPGVHSTHRAEAHRRCGATISPIPPHVPSRSDPGENGAACRRRARLCSGGHRKEAHPQGNREGARSQSAPDVEILALDMSLTIFSPPLSFCTITEKGRVPGQVARLVSQVSHDATFPIAAKIATFRRKKQGSLIQMRLIMGVRVLRVGARVRV